MILALSQKMTASPNAGKEATLPDEDIIPLDSYAMTDGYRYY